MARNLSALLLFAGIIGLFVAVPGAPDSISAQQPAQKQKADKPPPGNPVKTPEAEKVKIAKGFRLELIYKVPTETHGSWVCLATLPDGKLIASDQGDKGLFIITPPAVGKTEEPQVEPLNLLYEGKRLSQAQGLLWAFDALYVVVNGGASGLYRVTDSDKDGKLDKVEQLRKFEGGGGEHGPHALIKHPDGKRITVVCGNQTKLTKFDTSRVPQHWGEDHLLPRLPDGNGFMAGVNGPGGAIYHVTPDGKTWELFSVGFRNQYDAAYDLNGNLFTYDADMEWDFNTPWYRPTRVCQVTSGSEFGWRNGAGKYPAYYADNLPGVCDIGPGSPTGVCFGYGAKFPDNWQRKLFICDWSYGKLYAVQLNDNGGAMKGTAEEFIAGTPLPLTDITVNEKDGAMYFTTGGRKTQSGLYRVTYTGTDHTYPAHRIMEELATAEEMKKRGYRDSRKGFETQHMALAAEDKAGLERARGGIGSDDRFTRFAARISLEHQDTKLWADQVLAETNPNAAITGLLALVRSSAACPQHDKEGKHKGDPALRGKILDSLGKLDFAKLSVEQRLELIRVYHVLFNRFGPPTDAERTAWLAKYEPAFPTHQRFVDGELCQVFVYLQGPQTAAKTVQLLAEAPTQEEQMEYARALRMLKTGWTPELRKSYFEWFVKAQTYKGGNSFAKFVLMMKADAEKTLTPEEKTALQPTLDAKPMNTNVNVASARPFVKKHSMESLLPVIEKGLIAGGRDFDKGRKLFAATNCFSCHRFDNEGGSAGPDLSGLAGRFGPKDLLESVIDPNKEISDQYQAVQIDTLDGKQIVGRIVNLNGDGMQVMTNMLDPNGMISVKQSNIDRVQPSKISMMPAGLLDTLTDDEAIDLMAYLLSMGKRDHAAFQKK
jgi:putative heme-binding domain-containing protein